MVVRVVGIGASAGGLPAVRELLHELPERVGAAFVVLQHMPAERASELVDVIAGWTRLPVRATADGLAPEPDTVYVAAPSDTLTLEGGVFRSRPRGHASRGAGPDLLDSFFESLAEDRGPNAVAVVLSGSGTDGAAGAVVVRNAGGVVLVQDPATATHEGMPLAVIACDAADRVMAASELAREIVASASTGWVRAASAAEVRSSRETLQVIRDLVHERAGIDLGAYKPAPPLHRVHQRMSSLGIPRVRDYVERLRSDPGELDELVRTLFIHVTGFFCDRDAWRVLEHDVLPVILRARPGAQIRAWTPACATGEEAYSLAMLLAEQERDFRVFATDVAADVVEIASRGAFSDKAVGALTPERRRRFFDVEDGVWHVKRSLREKVIFARHDLLSDNPFGALDLVTCRNLLIYLEPKTAERAIGRLRECLRPGGHLFLGDGEWLVPPPRGFLVVSATAHVYRRGVETDDVAGASRELAASREELRVSNDQLDSTQADLSVSNARLRDKLAELEMQKNVLASGSVATLFLDDELRVRWYTPAMTALFPLREHDTGRPIGDLVPRFDDPSFAEQARAVMRSGEPREAEVQTREGDCYLLRVRPFHSADERASGVAVTFTDVTERKRANEALRASEARLSRDLADAERLQAISSLLIEHGDATALDHELVDAAAALMQSDGASLEMLDEGARELRLLAWKGLPPESARFWSRTSCERASASSVALRRRERFLVPDVFAEKLLEGSEDLAHYRSSGIVSVQSSPLFARDGRILGTMSTHWAKRHEPSARDLALFDVVTRQAADVIDRRRG